VRDGPTRPEAGATRPRRAGRGRRLASPGGRKERGDGRPGQATRVPPRARRPRRPATRRAGGRGAAHPAGGAVSRTRVRQPQHRVRPRPNLRRARVRRPTSAAATTPAPMAPPTAQPVAGRPIPASTSIPGRAARHGPRRRGHTSGRLRRTSRVERAWATAAGPAARGGSRPRRRSRRWPFGGPGAAGPARPAARSRQCGPVQLLIRCLRPTRGRSATVRPPSDGSLTGSLARWGGSRIPPDTPEPDLARHARQPLRPRPGGTIPA